MSARLSNMRWHVIRSFVALTLTMSTAVAQPDLVTQCRDARGGPSVIAACTRLLAIVPSALAYEHRAQAYALGGDDAKALDDLSAAIRLDGRRASAWYRRGQVLLRRDRFDEAIVDFTRVLELSPRDALALNARGWSLFKLGRYDAAYRDVEASLSLSPRYAPAYDTRAHIREALGQREAAIADFRMALTLDPDDPLVHLTLEGLRRLGAAPHQPER